LLGLLDALAQYRDGRLCAINGFDRIAGICKRTTKISVCYVLAILQGDGHQPVFKTHDYVRSRRKFAQLLFDSLGAKSAHKSIDVHFDSGCLGRCSEGNQQWDQEFD